MCNVMSRHIQEHKVSDNCDISLSKSQWTFGYKFARTSFPFQESDGKPPMPGVSDGHTAYNTVIQRVQICPAMESKISTNLLNITDLK